MQINSANLVGSEADVADATVLRDEVVKSSHDRAVRIARVEIEREEITNMVHAQFAAEIIEDCRREVDVALERVVRDILANNCATYWIGTIGESLTHHVILSTFRARADELCPRRVEAIASRRRRRAAL